MILRHNWREICASCQGVMVSKHCFGMIILIIIQAGIYAAQH